MSDMPLINNRQVEIFFYLHDSVVSLMCIITQSLIVEFKQQS